MGTESDKDKVFLVVFWSDLDKKDRTVLKIFYTKNPAEKYYDTILDKMREEADPKKLGWLYLFGMPLKWIDDYDWEDIVGKPVTWDFNLVLNNKQDEIEVIKTNSIDFRSFKVLGF